MRIGNTVKNSGYLMGMITAAVLILNAQSTAQKSPVKLEQIAPGVWFREGVPISRAPSRPDEMGNPNTVIIEMKDYLIVVDSSYPSGARLTMEAAKTVSSKPVKYVLVTYHHGDHSYGNADWDKAGATTVGHIGMVEEMMRYEPAGWRSASKWRKDVAAMSPAAAEIPLRVFEQSPFVLEDETRRIEMHHFGWAHTRGDSFIFLPKEKIICTGDALVNGGFNYIGHSSLRNWNNVLAKVQALGAQRVLPGHGRPGGVEIFDGQMKFLTELQKAVQSEIDRGKKLEDIVSPDPKRDPAFQLGNLQTTVKLPSSVRHWVNSDRLARQVSDSYAQLAGKLSPPPELISFSTEDGGTVFADLYGRGERGLVLVHGGRYNKGSWERQARIFADAGFRVIAIDLRGRGRSTGPGQADVFSAPLHLDVLAAVRHLRKTGAKSVSLIGGSLGGYAAGNAAAMAPDEIDRVVFLGSEGASKPELVKARKLFILCRDDYGGGGFRLPMIRKNYEASSDPKELVILECSAHAQFIFATEQDERLMKEILGFLSEQK